MYVMIFSFFFSTETKKPSVSPAVPSNEENETMPSGQGRSQEITSPSPRLWQCTVQEVGHIQPALFHILN